MRIKSMWPEVKGIFAYGCVDRGEGSSFRAKAHAHTKGCKNEGWICFRSIKRIKNCVVHNASDEWDAEQTSANLILLHEYAHILTNHGHDRVWGRKLKEIGGRLGDSKRFRGAWEGFHAKKV
jgi:hypothetical protein